MARKGFIRKRKVLPDSKFHSVLLTRFINKLMYDGKKGKAESIVYSALDSIKEKINKDPLEVFETALNNVAPELEVKSRRVGGATYQIPVEVSDERKKTLAIRWVIQFCRDKSGKSMSERLVNEIIDAYNNVGAAIKKRDDTHKMAEANKAFAHYRW